MRCIDICSLVSFGGNRKFFFSESHGKISSMAAVYYPSFNFFFINSLNEPGEVSGCVVNHFAYLSHPGR